MGERAPLRAVLLDRVPRRAGAPRGGQPRRRSSELAAGHRRGRTHRDARLRRAGGRAGTPARSQALPRGAGRRLSCSHGTKRFVVDGHTADLLVVAARARGQRAATTGVELFVVPGDAPGPRAARAADDGPDAPPGRARASTACACRADARLGEARAAAARCCAETLDLARDRARRRAGRRRAALPRSLGRLREGARAVRAPDRLVPGDQAQVRRHAGARRVGALGRLLRGLVAAAGGDAELAVAASLAKAYCSDAYFHCAADAIQIHGGVGFTWEYDPHLYFKRARSSRVAARRCPPTTASASRARSGL